MGFQHSTTPSPLAAALLCYGGVDGMRLGGWTRGAASLNHPRRKAYRTISVRVRRPSFSLMRTR